MDIDPDDVFRDDEDPENEYQQRDATKEMLVYLVDASPKMFSTVCPSEEQKDVSHFEATLSCILSSLKTQIINRSYDEVAICFFNTREKKNLQDLNGVYVFNVPEREDLDRPTARLIKEFDCLQESFSKQIGSKYGILPGTRDNSLYNALWAAQALLRKGSAKTADKRILLFTNEDDPFGNIKGVTKMDMMRTTIQRAKDAQDLGISIELLPLSTPDDYFNVSTFYADLLGLEGNALAEFKALATERFEEMNDQLRKRMFRKRKVRRINFIIANGISIELNTYALVRPTNPGAVTWLDSVTNLPIKTERSFFCSDTGALLQEPPKYFQTYKSENIMFTADELSEIKRASTGHLRLLGFKPLSCLEDYHNLRPSTFVFPSDEEVVGSSCIFIALHRSMLQLKRFAVAFYGGSTHPQLVALVAQDEIMSPSGQVEPPGMHMIYLPYSDDIRHIEELHTDPTHLTPRATEDQIKSATSLVKRIDLKNFSVCQFANPGEIFEEEKVEEEEVEVEEEEVEVEVEKVEVEEEVEVEEVKEEWVEKVHKWLFKEEEDMTWETYRYCSNWNTIERSILMKTIHNFAKANRPKDYWKVRTWMNLSDTYNEMAVRTNQIKRSYHEIIGGGKYLQSLFTIERQRHFHENTPVDQILLDIFEPCNECRNRIPVFPKSLLYNGSNPSTSFGSRTDSSSHSKKQWTPDELELLKSTISDFSSASMPKPYWDVQLWTDLSETYNVQARFKNLNTVSYLEFISGGMQLQSIFCEERLSNALHGFGSRGRDFVLMKIFEPCLECRKRIPVFPNGLPNNGSTSSASSSARSVQSHFTSYEDESYSATLNNMLIVVREMFEKGLLTSAQLSIVTLKLHDFAQTETWKVCLLNNIFTLEMKREVLIQSISPEA